MRSVHGVGWRWCAENAVGTGVYRTSTRDVVLWLWWRCSSGIPTGRCRGGSSWMMPVTIGEDDCRSVHSVAYRLEGLPPSTAKSSLMCMLLPNTMQKRRGMPHAVGLHLVLDPTSPTGTCRPRICQRNCSLSGASPSSAWTRTVHHWPCPSPCRRRVCLGRRRPRGL